MSRGRQLFGLGAIATGAYGFVSFLFTNWDLVLGALVPFAHRVAPRAMPQIAPLVQDAVYWASIVAVGLAIAKIAEKGLSRL